MQSGEAICQTRGANADANAERIVACWNACAGFDGEPEQVVEELKSIVDIIADRKCEGDGSADCISEELSEEETCLSCRARNAMAKAGGYNV